MILLRVVAGTLAGREASARRFPFRVGRAADCDWRLEAPGVWDRQFEITMAVPEGFFLSGTAGGLTLVNGQQADRVPLKNGDCIEFGGVKLQFWLGPMRQRGLAAREIATWVALVALVAVQGGLCWWLLQ